MYESRCEFTVKVLYCLSTVCCTNTGLKVARYSCDKNPAQNQVIIFTRGSRKLINKMKELPK